MKVKRCVLITKIKHANQGLSFSEEYPAESRVLLDRLQEIITEKGFESESKEVKEKWMALHDAHQNIRKDTPVGIFGLNSAKGKEINGSLLKDTHFAKYTFAKIHVWKTHFRKIPFLKILFLKIHFQVCCSLED